MTAGYNVPGRGDLDTLLKARTSAKRADVGYGVAGVDISNRYEPIGATTPIAATGYKSAGTDIANLFMNISAVTATHTLVAGTSLGMTGYSTSAHSSVAYGSLSPTTINAVEVHIIKNDANYLYVVLEGSVSKTFFTSIKVNGVTYNTNATYDYYQTGVTSWWQWAGSPGMVNGNTYPITVT